MAREANVRQSDRIMLEIGENVAPRAGADLVVLTPAQETAIAAVLAAPNGGVTISAGGVVAGMPFVAPPPPADAAAFANAVAQLKATFNTPRTLAQVNNSLDALTIVVRRLFNELT